ncbi:winged helix-turn-helix domain-containing protein [Methylocella sp.]|uniref:winged helix-turn-helix domain-containing protein n=1 Tax=Methylocella sp. TaxID=1978226 RepID=UPI0037834839
MLNPKNDADAKEAGKAEPSRRRPDRGEAAALAIELRLPNGGWFGEEEFAVIEAIRSQRSIIGASRALGLSYRKCWLVADMLNRCFESPVIMTYPGRRSGGAEISQFGDRLVALYRSIGRHAATSAKKSLDELTGSLDWSFDPKARVAAPANEAG